MAGTIVADTIQDGAGNSTSMDNAIYGSAKAWVNFNGVSTVSIRASYNVSSVTRNSTGDYTVNFTNAFSDANYSAVATGNGPALSNYGRILGPYSTAPTASAFRFNSNDYAGSFVDLLYASVAFFR